MAVPAALVVAALGGCGSSNSPSKSKQAAAGASVATSGTTTTGTTTNGSSTGASSEYSPSATTAITLPVLTKRGYLPARYTCDGADVSPPLRWGSVPPKTAELALFVINLQPVHGKLFFDWAVTGLKPSLSGLAAGALPPGAIVGRNSFGREDYSICPSKGRRENYLVKLVAVSHQLGARPGFDATSIQQTALNAGLAQGLIGAIYRRR